MRSPTGRFTSRDAPATQFRRALRTAAIATTIALQLAVLPGVAGADGAPASASEAYVLKARADAAMDQGAFATAILGYRSSYELSHSPALLYNIGSAYERLGDYPRALAYLERFATVASPLLKARVPRLDELVGSVRARLARIVVQCSVRGARILVRGEWQGTTPLPADIMAPPGDALVEVVADGYRPYVQQLALQAGKEARVDAVLVPELVTQPTPPPKRPAPASAPITSKWWFWTGIGVIVAGETAAFVLSR
jgi:tetratricopeptide (TPR) repeat protein